MHIRSIILAFVSLALLGEWSPASRAQTPAPTITAKPALGGAVKTSPSPWGISSSSGSRRTYAEWFPQMQAAGVKTVRSFPVWGEVEPRQGEWTWDKADAQLADAERHQLEINGILMGKAPWTAGGSHRFPMENLDDWAKYVETIVGRYKGKITYWEVWNEGNAGFNDGKHTTADYSKLVAVAYDAAKKANPDAMIGLSVASFDAQYLHQTMLELKKIGKPTAFDWLAIHPYEIADLLLEPDGEIPFLWMTQHLRKLTKSACPERADCEIWITEIGHRIGDHHGRKIDDQQAARALVKMYVMAAAQGIRCIQWFEARDPVNEDAGFGVIDKQGKPRVAYTALKTLTEKLGPNPKYLGFDGFFTAGSKIEFYFERADGQILSIWWGMDQMNVWKIAETYKGEVVDLLTGAAVSEETERKKLSTAPRANLNVRLSDEFRRLLDEQRTEGIPTTVGVHPKINKAESAFGLEDQIAGVYKTSRSKDSVMTFPDGTSGLYIPANQWAAFWVHPSFAGPLQREYYVRATLRRLTPGNLGMNFFYEYADTQGKTPYKSTGQWYSVAPDLGWQTKTWHVKDAGFSKIWGHDFSLRPEKSDPYVLQKIEVSTMPFEEKK